MSVNTGKSLHILLIGLFAAILLSGCLGKGRAPYVSFISASSRLRESGTSNRVDVVVDVRNQRSEEYSALSLTVSFANGREVTFKWDKIKAYGYVGGEEVMEVTEGVSKSSMLGGTFETLVDDVDNSFHVYATEVSAAFFSYKDATGSVYKKDISREVSKTMEASFGKLSKEDAQRSSDRKKRLEKLKKKAALNK